MVDKGSMGQTYLTRLINFSKTELERAMRVLTLLDQEGRLNVISPQEPLSMAHMVLTMPNSAVNLEGRYIVFSAKTRVGEFSFIQVYNSAAVKGIQRVVCLF